MKKSVLIFSTLMLSVFCLSANAHNWQQNRGGSYIQFGYSDNWYSPYPSNSLIGGISYRNSQSFRRLQNRHLNNRFDNGISNRRSYQRGYRNGYRDGRLSSGRYFYNQRQVNSNCYAIYYDHHGNRVRRSISC